MTKNEKQWLQAMPWDSVVTLNKALCQAQKVEHLADSEGAHDARALWEKASSRKQSIGDAFQICHDCHDLVPFTFNNGNTFAAIGRTLVEDYLQQMPPVEAQIIRTTIGHFIVGLIGRKELKQVLRHFEEELGNLSLPEKRVPTPSAATMQAGNATV